MVAKQVSVIGEGGAVALPPEFLKRYGLKQGDQVSFVATSGGLKIMPPTEAVMRLLDAIGDELRSNGVTFEELMEESEQIRQDIYEERYGTKNNNAGLKYLLTPDVVIAELKI